MTRANLETRWVRACTALRAKNPAKLRALLDEAERFLASPEADKPRALAEARARLGLPPAVQP